jgi:1-pyrroline-5-carboxylate dehydrogenase
MNENDKG